MIVAAMLALSTAAEPHIAFEWPADMSGQTILFAGAHPDDEWGLAPLLAQACLDRGARCHFAVASEGHSYGCMLGIGLRDPEECARRRRIEMAHSAAWFGAKAEFFGWEDLFYAFNQSGVTKTAEDWATAAGGHDKLVGRWVQVLREQNPSVVFTLDPRHGSTCHPGHRANALLVVEAVNALPAGERPQLWFEQTDNIDDRSPAVAAANKQAGYVAWPIATEQVQWFDANQKLRNGLRAYDYALAVRRTHATQYPAEVSGRERPYAPAELRYVPVVRYTGQSLEDLCSELKIDLPTFDIPGNKKKFGLE